MIKKRKRSVPPFSAENPGVGVQLQVEFSDDEETWEEEVSALDSLATVLEARGISFERTDELLELADGLIVRPQFFQLNPRDDGSVQTSTTIEINHPTLCADGMFEYQHSIGETLDESLQRGFAGWADTDLPVFLDALREQPEDCSSMMMEYPAEGSMPARKRQILFGPPTQTAARQQQEPADEEHSFCPCCLLTNCLDAFEEQLKSDSFHGVRLFASRNSEGLAEADCRINGVDFPAGAAALLKYVATWPGKGFEMRKQFVAIRTLSED
jgi:hypothetical protein